jgi:hypothetical protein
VVQGVNAKNVKWSRKCNCSKLHKIWLKMFTSNFNVSTTVTLVSIYYQNTF